jgi:hypothetical protein
MNPLSPLQRVPSLEKEQPVFLKREDLISPGGGNKVRRFQAFFEKHKDAKKVATLSDPGAHTFQILKHFLKENIKEDIRDETEDQGQLGAEQLIFLERDTPLTPYAEIIREHYRYHPDIRVSQASSFIQLLKYTFYKYASFGRVKTVGIGGNVKISPNPFEQAMEECLEQLQRAGVEGDVVHLFPISSGNMADGFLHYVHRKGVGHHSFIGITTGDRLSIPWLKLKYVKEKKIKLIKPASYSYKGYCQKALAFHQKTSVWLDPIHTIHLTDALEKHSFPQDSTIVLWITCPFIKKLTL